jgi:hypothetical protein
MKGDILGYLSWHHTRPSLQSFYKRLPKGQYREVLSEKGRELYSMDVISRPPPPVDLGWFQSNPLLLVRNPEHVRKATVQVGIS